MTDRRAIMGLPIASIAVGPRIGFYNPEHAARLGASIAAEGQHDPIHVKRNGNAAKLPWTLVAGLHRMRGAALAGLTTIDAIQVAEAGATELTLRKLELSENLDHSERRPIERAILMIERARLEEANDHPGHVGEPSQVRAARARWDASITMMDASGWRDRAAAAMGCSVPTLERYTRVYRHIVEGLPDLAEALNFHPLGESLSAMMRLASLNETARRTAAETILSRPDWGSMDQVLAAAGLAESKGSRIDADKLGNVMVNTWAKMPISARQAHVEWLVDNITPSMANDMVVGFKKRGLLP
ncbi:ParB/RepB/Spo0J family partition protein [Sphingomonas elodea]|uniref:ParB/RepB/Spo0J family partition protein n=1 Tax=Sphingomonas elodea TaxID=179878 RepID=UPI0002631E3A|nr:ParB/RepB/Spo0J family partition protein [Sphingomonas elodea]